MKIVWMAGPRGVRDERRGLVAVDDLQARRRQRSRDLYEQAHAGRGGAGSRTTDDDSRNARGTLAPASPKSAAAAKPVATLERVDRNDKPIAAAVQPTLAAIEPQVQRKRDNDRRRILEEELSREEQSLTGARDAITQEQQNPQLVAAVRVMQQAQEPSAAQMVEMRGNIEKASGRIRGLQSTVAEHEKNIEALKKELGALKP
jgi:hypothetical protein